ncbi:MAG: MoxR family ATPase [Gammaproteobacteria bacterium]|nr:MoxR family ATPase [Gammaproteobacteria bacterium]
MTTTHMWPQQTVAESSSAIGEIVAQLNGVILGKEEQIRLCVACLLARGHLLIEDIPGVGKTTLAHALAHTLGLSYHRIQFTSDLLPADILGVSIYEREGGEFRFHPGPVFSQLVLADEINRATPKTQSALLEAMEENQVTADGQTHALPVPFFVVATQNPAYQIGTFPLPESQLDRFLMRIELGYPGPAVEKELLTGRDRRDIVADLNPSISIETLVALQKQVSSIHVSEALVQYLQQIVAFTRESAAFASGLSPRAAIVLLRGAQAWALMAGHRGVLPEDIQAVTTAVIAHRLRPRDETAPQTASEIGQFVLESVSIP